MIKVKSAARVLDLLELFSGIEGELGVSEVSRRFSIPKSSAQGLLMTLALRGYLERRGSSYAMPKSLQNGQWISGPHARLARFAQPLMERMAKESEESAFLGVLTDGFEIQYIAKACSANELRYDASLEHLRPAYSTSIGLVILAHIGEDVVKSFFASVRLRRITEKTTTDRTALNALILRARRQGHAELRDMNIAGVSGVSAPVFGPTGQVMAGLNLGAPSPRFAKARGNLTSMVKRYAAELSSAWALANTPSGQWADGQPGPLVALR